MGSTRKVKAELSIDERNLILEHVSLFHPGLEEKIRKKRSRNGYVTVELNAEELADLLGCMAREANHTSKKWLENALDEIFEQLQCLEDSLRFV